MNPNLASLLALVPNTFNDLGIVFDSFKEPLLVVTIVKEADGSLMAIVKPDVGVTKKLNERINNLLMRFQTGSVYEIRFAKSRFECFIDNKPADPEDHGCLAGFLNRFADEFCCMAEQLVQTFMNFPPTKDLADVIDIGIEQKLMSFLINGMTEGFMVGPTTTLMISEREARMAKKTNPLENKMEMKLKIQHECMGREIETDKALEIEKNIFNQIYDDWSDVRNKVMNLHNIVILAPLDHEHPHFKLFTTIVTAAAQTFLTPELVEAKRQAILVKVRPVIATINAAEQAAKTPTVGEFLTGDNDEAIADPETTVSFADGATA